MSRLAQLPGGAWLERLLRLRFLKFGVVGASGTVVNLLVLFLGREYLFAAVMPVARRLDLALALAIFCATINNFLWNRAWTWTDRGSLAGRALAGQFFKYASACWLGILIQFAMTRTLSDHLHYLLANVVAIVLASVFNYLLNDRWTFNRRRVARARAMAGVDGVQTRS